MKRAKLFLAVALLWGMMSPLRAQVKMGLEVKAGLNIAGVYYSDTYDSKRSITPGFHTGALASVNFPTGFYLESGLLLTTKGHSYKYKYKEDKERFLSERHYSYGYLEMPFYAGYRLKLRKVNLLWKAGPYVAAALWGNSREEWTHYKKKKVIDHTVRNSHSLSIGNSTSDDLRRFDVGFNLATGVEINRFTAGIQYGIGFTDILPSHSESTSNQVFSISLGYRFF